VSNAIPVLVSNAFSLVAESCLNGGIDPNELVTVNLGLRNVGSANTTNLVATLQGSGGVTSPSGPQSYGAVSLGGGFATRTFSFVPSGSCGGNLIATIQL